MQDYISLKVKDRILAKEKWIEHLKSVDSLRYQDSMLFYYKVKSSFKMKNKIKVINPQQDPIFEKEGNPIIEDDKKQIIFLGGDLEPRSSKQVE